MHRPTLFIARSWSGNGGMQRLNRDVLRHVGGARTGFHCIHPVRRSIGSLLSFVSRAIFSAVAHRGRGGRVHAGDMAALPLGLLCSWLGGMKLSVTACGLDVIYPKAFYQRTIRFCLKYVDRVICISSATAEEVRKRGVNDDRIVIIPCGIAESSPLPERQRDPLLLLTVGRLVKRKGVAWFLEHVFVPLLRESPDLRYVIMGDGPERKNIEQTAYRLHLEHAVRLLPQSSDDDRRDVMLQSAAFIAPNIRVQDDMEGFGIVCLEAAEAGLPVVAANIEGLKDAVIDGKTGTFFISENPDDCMRVIKDAIKHPMRASDVHQAVIDRFDWRILAPLYDDVFDA